MHTEDERLSLPTPLMNGALYAAVGSCLVAVFFAITYQETSNGRLTYFRDWGAVGFGTIAILSALVALPSAFSPLEPQHRYKRLAIAIFIMPLALLRVLYGAGLFT